MINGGVFINWGIDESGLEQDNLHAFQIPEECEEENEQVESCVPFDKRTDIDKFQHICELQNQNWGQNEIGIFFNLVAPRWTETQLFWPKFSVHLRSLQHQEKG